MMHLLPSSESPVGPAGARSQGKRTGAPFAWLRFQAALAMNPVLGKTPP